MIKHIKESLGQYLDWQYFSVLEAKKEEPLDEKKMKSEEEKEGLDVIKKLQDNLERFKSAAGDKIIKYKEFWKENQEVKDKFDEDGSLYKMFDSDYVAGVINLPDEALSEEEINAQIEEVDKEKEEEEKEEGEEHEEGETPEEDEQEGEEIKESLNEEENLDLDLEEKPEKEEEEIFDQPELGGEEKSPEFAEPEGEETSKEEELDGEEETPEDESEEEEEFASEESETKEFFAVFDMAGSEREEVFRTDNPSVIIQFTDFFENSFKACMKEQIARFKQAQEDKRNEAELKAKEKQREERKGKLNNFLKKA
jgi:midasin